MRSKSFEVKQIGQKKHESQEAFPFYGWDNRRCFPDGRKEMQRPGEIENLLEKIHATPKKML